MGVCKLLQFVFPLWNFPEHSTYAFAPSLIQSDDRNKKYHSPKKRQEKKEKALQGTFPPPEDNTNSATSKSKKRSDSLRILPDRSSCLPDELLRRNFELNVDFVIHADLDFVDRHRNDHICVPVNHLPLNILYQKYFHLQQKLPLSI